MGSQDRKQARDQQIPTWDHGPLAGVSPTQVTLARDHLGRLGDVRSQDGHQTGAVGSGNGDSLRWVPVWNPAGLGCGESLLERTLVHCHNAWSGHSTPEKTTDILRLWTPLRGKSNWRGNRKGGGGRRRCGRNKESQNWRLEDRKKQPIWEARDSTGEHIGVQSYTTTWGDIMGQLSCSSRGLLPPKETCMLLTWAAAWGHASIWGLYRTGPTPHMGLMVGWPCPHESRRADLGASS